MNDKSKPTDPLAEYRKWLVAAEQKSQEDFDKTVLSLSGGALGISFVFLKDVIGTNPILHPSLLFASWLAWAFSTFAVLTSYYLSHLALRNAISQLDAGKIYKQRPGGTLALWTAFLNATGAILFLIGVCCITAFAYLNLSTKGATNGRQETTVAPIAPNSRTAPGSPIAPSSPTAPSSSTGPKSSTGLTDPNSMGRQTGSGITDRGLHPAGPAAAAVPAAPAR